MRSRVAITISAAFLGVILTAVDVASQNCLRDVKPDLGANACTSNNFKFDGVSGATAYDGLTQPACNCGTCGSIELPRTTFPCTEPDCANVPNDGGVECDGMPEGTVYGACLGNDDSIDVALEVDFTASNDQPDIGIYIA